MTFSETGNGTPNPEHHEKDNVIGQCQAELGELSAEIKAEQRLPNDVMLYFNEHLPDGKTGIAVNEALKMLEINPNIFSVPDGLLPLILQPCIAAAELQEIDSNIDESQAAINRLKDESELQTLAKTDLALKNLKGRALLKALESHDLVKASPYLQDYLGGIHSQIEAIRNVAVTPAEATALDNILDTIPLYFGADNMGAVFSDVLVAADNSPDISETTKAKLQTLFNIPTIKTAGDLQTVLTNGYGVDSDGHKLQINQDQKLRVFPNTYLYETPSGDRIFEIAVAGDRTYKVRFDEGTNEQALYESAITIQMMGLMAQMNLAAAIWPRGWTLQEGGIIDLHYDDVITAKRVSNLMLGNNTGYDGRMISSENQVRMNHNFQAFPKKGDAATGDNDPDKALSDYKELTIVNQDGAINWIQFEEAALYLQGVTAKGGQPNFDDLKTHLTNGWEATV